MGQRKILGPVVLSLCGLFLVPGAVAADPVTVTGGSLFIDDLGSLELTGERGFALSASVSRFSGSVAWDACVRTSCAPGDTLSLHSTWVGLDVRSGVLTFEGETYPVRDDAASVGVQFEGSYTAPALAPTAVVTAPFTLVPRMPWANGVSGFSLSPFGPSFALDGSGMATISLSRYFEVGSEGTTFFDGWKVDSIRYDFSATEPVPEPATMLLVGLGMAAAARKVKRRRSQG